MSREAARAMRDLAECFDEVAEEMPAGMAFACVQAMAQAHRKCAERLEARYGKLEEGLGLNEPPRFKTKAQARG